MKEITHKKFVQLVKGASRRIPIFGQIELTYQCCYNCIHCYCRNESRKEKKPLFWKRVIDQVYSLGGIEITFTGGEPLLYKGFLEVYSYAVKKGFIVNVFTTGFVLDKQILGCFKAYPPASIEITLNSLNEDNYSRITRSRGAFPKVMSNIHKLKANGFPLVLKSNGLKENKNEILKIKRFSEKLLGKRKFKFDSFIFPGLQGEREPLEHRLSVEDIIAIEKKSPDMLKQRIEQIRHKGHSYDSRRLYHCNTWEDQYFISPQGILQFCNLTKDYSTDLNNHSFKLGFNKFLKVCKEEYKTSSKCRACLLKELCYKCPARSYLETKDKCSPVEYYCQLAKASKKFREELGSKSLFHRNEIKVV
jgi:MoaA/NifB/PqqE/SkfB family radical SAM enzyme